MKMTKLMALAAALLMLATAFAGCSGTVAPTATQAATQQPATPEPTPEAKYWDMLGTAQDSSDLPDWTGEQLKLKVWYASGTGNLARDKVEQDVIWPEIKRVTGIDFDVDNSFDNAGQTYAVKLGMLNAANDWPDIIVLGQDCDLKTLADAGKIYDMTDVFDQYCPNYVKRVPRDVLPDVYNQIQVNAGQQGKIFAFPGQIGPEWLPKIKADIDMARLSYIAAPQELGGWTTSALKVRDDILKKIFPAARTVKETQDLYMQNGKFTKEEIFDVQINSKEDFYKFLRDIKALNITENGKPVEPTFLAGDSFALMDSLNSILHGYTVFNTHWTYWDKKAQKVQYMYKQDWFKEDVRNLTELVQDGTIPKESLVDTDEVLGQKIANGQYAVTYAWFGADNGQLEKDGKPYRYRTLHLNIMPDYDNFQIMTGKPNSGNMMAVFKDKVKEENLEQVMRFMDFMSSDVGSKLIYWGPRSAGLWEEKDGKRIYKDKDLEQNMVYGLQNDANMKYNLYNEWNPKQAAWPKYPKYCWGGDNNHPRYTYDRTRSIGEAGMFFQTGQVVKLQETLGEPAHIWNFQNKVAAVDQWTKAKQVSEDAFKRIFTAKDDTQFEKLYAEFLEINEQNGLTDAALEEINKVYQDDVNKGYMDFRTK